MFLCSILLCLRTHCGLVGFVCEVLGLYVFAV